ncbi:acyl-CoA desaturase [bacterium]|nr:acyl-CoA desaturase [bacterium]
MSKVAFIERDACGFVTDLKAAAADYFTRSGISDKANFAMIRKTVVILTLTFGAYALILSGQFAPWEMLILAITIGIGVAGMGFSIGHDALHGAYSSHPWINRIFGLTFDLVGANGYMWKLTHNVIHHTYTNIHGVDEDLVVSPLLRLSPHTPHQWFHRFQHLYAFLAYSFTTIFWVFIKDYKYFMLRDLGPYKNIKHPFSQVVTMLFMKMVYYSWTIIIPMIVLPIPWWQIAIGYVAMNLTAGLILGIVFQLAHVVEHTEHPLPDSAGNMELAWTLHEMATTSDFGRTNKFLSWYIGGLNFQIEHHLFPKVCSIHYPSLSKIVESLAAKHGIPYHVHPTMRAAVASHYRTLKNFGRPLA